jgi:hypothetical protein
MVCGCFAVEAAGSSVSQWADASRIARGRGTSPPNMRMKSRAGWSSISKVGAPCDRKSVGRRFGDVIGSLDCAK